jgi:hypothetical protein
MARGFAAAMLAAPADSPKQWPPENVGGYGQFAKNF